MALKKYTLPNGKSINYQDDFHYLQEWDGTHCIVDRDTFKVIWRADIWIQSNYWNGVPNTAQYIPEDERGPIPPITPIFDLQEALKEVEKPKKKEYDMDKTKLSDLFSYKKLSDYTGLTGKIPVRAGTTYIGLEIELEKVQLKNDIVGTWAIHEDGSLKVEGKEFVTIPIQFQYLEVELERLFKSLHNCEASSRCSVHVHLNSRDFTLNEYKTFMSLYMIFERSLYRFSGDRWNNNFCVPLNFYPGYVREHIDFLDGNKYIRDIWYKYFGFNVSPIFGGESKKTGTIEFRQMKGTVDKKWILDWVNLIVSLKIYAKKITFAELLKHIETMNTTSAYYWLCDEVFKDYSRLISGQDTYKDDVESCISKAKLVFLKSTKGMEEVATIKGEA